MDNIKIQNLPPYAKLFVGIFTALMLSICFWAIVLFYVDKGMVSEGTLPPYLLPDTSLSQEQLPEQEEIAEDIEVLSEDSLARLAPIWDSVLSGEEKLIDSATMAKYFTQEELTNNIIDDESKTKSEHLRENIGLAHTHINGQTLLYFALGFLFLFTSVKPKIKKILLTIFGVAIFLHAIGLSGEDFHWFFDDILAISGLTILFVIPCICLIIFMDLIKTPSKE